MRQPRHQVGNRYTFQFQGSGGAPWKQRRKLSSTTAAAASVTIGLMFSRSCLRAAAAQQRHGWADVHYVLPAALAAQPCLSVRIRKVGDKPPLTVTSRPAADMQANAVQ